MLTPIILDRVFKVKIGSQEISLDDPSPKFTPERVMNFYSGAYPILTTAKVEGPEIFEDQILYRFTTTLGTKG